MTDVNVNFALETADKALVGPVIAELVRVVTGDVKVNSSFDATCPARSMRELVVRRVRATVSGGFSGGH